VGRRTALSWWLGIGAVLGATPEERAIAYLAVEAPAWSKQNRCFSCHNNGDGARALYRAWELGLRVPSEAMADTTGWLARPAEWGQSRDEGGASDTRLAQIQFGASLAGAVQAGLVEDRRILFQAAEALAAQQQPDGSWVVDAGSGVGSPATYGKALATVMASRTLAAADALRFAGPVARAGRWLAETPAKTILDAAAVVMALGDRRPEALELLLRGQGAEGGWGPYVNAPPETFDTAVAVLALASVRHERERIGRGRQYLVRSQLPSGGWTETTRPSGGRSYAQHISTTAWATLALLETR